MPHVTYVVTLYNKAPFLPHLLAGLAAQEGGFARDFVFVDDGSGDGTPALLRRLVRGWEGVRILEQANAGPSAALNRGLAEAKGELIKPLDGDDVLAPWATQRLLAALEETGCPVAYAAMERQGRYDASAGSEAILAGFTPAPAPARRIEEIFRLSLRSAQTNPTAWLARRELVEAVGGCDPQIFVQDYSIEIRMAARAPFARLEEEIFRQPREAPGRLSTNVAQTLHDMNLAVLNLLRSSPDLPPALVALAMNQVSGRAWHWARRQRGKTWLSAEFLTFLAARLRLLRPTPAVAQRVCAPFLASGGVRRTA